MAAVIPEELLLETICNAHLDSGTKTIAAVPSHFLEYSIVLFWV
jgi:hypothetical protein